MKVTHTREIWEAIYSLSSDDLAAEIEAVCDDWERGYETVTIDISDELMDELESINDYVGNELGQE